MLTATYSLVAITAEHDNARGILSRLQQYIQNIWHGIQNVDFTFLDAAFDKISQFDEYCHNRKVELYLIPALRNATREADTLLAELDSLSEAGIRIMQAAQDQLTEGLHAGGARVEDICHAMVLYCDYMFTRLTKEDEQLFPMARRLLSIEEWFAVAAKFLSDDADADGRKRYALPHLRQSLASPSSPLSAN